MLKDYYNTEDLVECLDIDEVSAEEFLEGTIEFEMGELYMLAAYKNIDVGKLFLLTSIT